MRALMVIAFAAVAAPAPAHADMEVERPPPAVRVCASGSNIASVLQCLQRLGRATVVRELPHARLVRLEQKLEGGGHVDLGMSLYVERAGTWRLGGSFEAQGTYELLAADTVRSGTHEGYRVDVADVRPTTVSFGEVSTVRAMLVAHRVLLCGGEGWRCTETMIACDVLVDGRAYYTFRGTLTVADNVVRIDGARDHAGDACSVPVTDLLGWPQR